MGYSHRGLWPILCAALFLVTQPPAAADELDDAEKLLAGGAAAQAYERLAPLEMETAGDPRFDYLFGMAALDSGRPGEAVFALQRAVAADPDFAGARMELARAQFESGELESARRQFEYLLSQSPPPTARATIDQYLLAIKNRGRSQGFGLRPYVDFGAGYDSNANGSTAEQSFLGFTLNPNNVETASAFFEPAFGFSHIARAGAEAAWISDLRLSHRFNPDADFVDQSLAAGSTGFNWMRGGHRVSAMASAWFGLLDGDDHEWGAALDLGVGQRIGESWDLGLKLRGGPVRYQDVALEILDVDRYLGGLTLTHLGLGKLTGRWGVTAIGGMDEERVTGSAHGNERLGGRLFAGWVLTPTSGIYIEGGYLTTTYDETPGFFGIAREDKEWSALLATEYQNWPGKGWTMSPRLRYAAHDSNVSLYEYDRWEAGVYLRRNFK